MKLSDVVSFRKDLLFNGAVQVSWLEDDQEQARKAAEHFVFHGPSYHGVSKDVFPDSEHELMDTASFTYDILRRLTGFSPNDPFVLAIAGYGTGKSHLAVTLSQLLHNPASSTARSIINNLVRTDGKVGNKVATLLETASKPNLVVTINGMKDFDLSNEITRQILQRLASDNVDSGVLENLRPRFKIAENFVESFYGPLQNEFEKHLGNVDVETIIHGLRAQNEQIFSKVSEIYSQKIGTPIHAVGRESLHDFIKVTSDNFCGDGKPYGGILLLFDEFGRYLEFSVQKPHIAGSGALQQLFECVQANEEHVKLVCFIQYELKAYISRVAPEAKEDLERYVSRYQAVDKARLSTNIETLIANVLEKKDPETIERQMAANIEEYKALHSDMKNWFPELNRHSLWENEELFKKVVCEGCWPLHPLSTWVLYRLSTGRRSLQQRSALSLLAEIYDGVKSETFELGENIAPAYMCNESLINEFLASERSGQQGALAYAYQTAIDKYKYELNENEIKILKSILVSSKIDFKVNSKEECKRIVTLFSGLNELEASEALDVLENELAVLEWNSQILRFEITGDAVPRRAFLSYLEDKILDFTLAEKSELFMQHYKTWMGQDIYPTDFGLENEITTKDWDYTTSYSSVEMIKAVVDFAVKNWIDSKNPDQPKGQLIYCYAGPRSDIESTKITARKLLKASFEKNGIRWGDGAPIGIIFIHDKTGIFGDQLAEYFVLTEKMSVEDRKKYSHFIGTRKEVLEREMQDVFNDLMLEKNFIFATDADISLNGRMKKILTLLFESIYPKVLPFNFDGFGTVRGNAVKDSAFFTRQLASGGVDREWISGLTQQQRNRAHPVFVDSWGIFNDDGTLRRKPINPRLRDIIELIESEFESDSTDLSQPLNLGDLMDVLCAPPYGLNIASAGLVLALFLGSRDEEVGIVERKTLTEQGSWLPISVDKWLTQAISGNYFDLAVLKNSAIVRVSNENMSEWAILLEDWDLEKTINGILSFEKKAIDVFPQAI